MLRKIQTFGAAAMLALIFVSAMPTDAEASYRARGTRGGFDELQADSNSMWDSLLAWFES
jgi:hypothetical protein